MQIVLSRQDQAIFNFGDSNSDTGAFYSAFLSQPSPYGMTYFKRPTGRATDGRLYVDFLGEFQLFHNFHVSTFALLIY